MSGIDFVILKRVTTLLSLTLLLLSQSATAGLLQDDHFLDQLQVNRFSDRIELVISFTQPLRYSSHAPAQMGRIITVQLASTARVESESIRFDGKNRISWKPTAALSLSEVIAQNQGDNPELILHFKRPVSFKIKRSAEHQSLTIQLPISDYPGQKMSQPTVELNTSGLYVINLLSMRKPINRDLIAKRYPQLNKHHLYLTHQIINKERYQRLRLGFFTKQQASRLLSEIKWLNPDFSSAWISRITKKERQSIIDGGKKPVQPTPPIKPLPGEITRHKIEKRMDQARQAIINKNYHRAIAIYTDIAEYPLQPYQENALELLGMTYERKGQLAHAKRSYQRYLEAYPESDATARVKQRLAGLVTANLQDREKLYSSQPADDSQPWDIFGSFSQYYHEDVSETDESESRTIDSSLSSDLDLNARKRTENLNMKFRFSGGYDNDFLESDEDEGRVSMLYLDLSDHNNRHTSRIGRQRRTSSGIFGRFDGLYYGYTFHPKWRLNFTSGGLVESSSDGVTPQRNFNGISLDYGPINDQWNFNLFAIDQRTTSGIIDRQAIGGEIRHFSSQRSLFVLADYDLHFEALNIAYLLGSWTLTPRTTLNTLLDYRLSPLTTTTSALQSQSATDIDQLNEHYSLSEIKQIAKDRSAVSKSASLGLTHTFTPRWQITSDVTVTNMEATQASAGVEANPGTGNEFFLSTLIIGNALLKEGDMMLYSVRYSDTSHYEKISLSTNIRYPIVRHWRVNPRLRFDYKENDNNTKQITWVPSFRTNYRWKRRATFELELGVEMTEDQFETETKHSNYLFAYTGYRIDF
jgi:hypothetical protein